MSATFQGTSFIGYTRGETGSSLGSAINPANGESFGPDYHAASDAEVTKAIELAGAAFPAYSNLPAAERAKFLRVIADKIDAAVEDIAARGPLETGLPEPRMRGETARTTGQLRLFAGLIEEGSWVDARIDHAQPDREPIPKPDLRAMKRPLGPVAVFCASNFPLAFSVAGGDTAAALAAGCPVIAKAHSSHPGVAEIVGACVAAAAQECGMPEGVFSLLYGGGRTVGMALVKHPIMQAVGFTGSRAGGTALMEAAAQRPQPIPVYAEMSAVNPVVFLPASLAKGGEALAEAFFGSLTLGVGQFCTNPGLVFLPEGHGDDFLAKLCDLVKGGAGGVMLNAGICSAFAESTTAVAGMEGVETLAAAPTEDGRGTPAVFAVSLDRFREDPALQAEMFGPATLVVRGKLEDMAAAMAGLEGQLVGTIHASPAELSAHADLVTALESRVGRLVCNGFPTGVEVCPSMVHGGPYPATSDGRSTSVGTMAIDRFCRPVSWQGFPDEALPAELQESNPLGIWRLVDGEQKK